MPTGMEERSPTGAPDSGSSRAISRVLALLEVAFVALVGSFVAGWFLYALGWEPATAVTSNRNALVFFLFTEAFVTLLIILALLRLQGEGLETLGSTGAGVIRETGVGLAMLPVLFTLVVGSSLLFQSLAPGWVSEVNPLLELIEKPTDVFWFVMTGIFVGGFKEEIQRAFILDRFERHLGGAVAGLIIWSALFGAGHWTQGPDRAFQAGLLGLAFGILYLRRRSLIAPIVSHALYDVVVVLAAFFFTEV